MLSILIPEYNYDCSKLVAQLVDQCRQADVPFEILVMDDASANCLEANREISKMPGCQFFESEVNLKSARIRNRLGQLAKYPYLLFLDCDLEIRDRSFIRRYLDALGKAPVVVGTIVYQAEKPPISQRLRWKYGSKREVIPLEVRNENPWKSFSSPNFLMEKAIFERLPFDETFVDYGHEDTLFGLSLKSKGIEVKYIDNPLIHNGLETNEAFLTKSLVAVEKYAMLPVMRSPEVVGQIRIYRFYESIVALKLDGLLAFKFRLLKKCLHKQLCSANPNLIVFDFYRLGHLCDFIRKRRRSGLEV